MKVRRRYTIGASIHACRLDLGISQAELARRVGCCCSASLLSQAEGGWRVPSYSLLCRLSRALGLAGPEGIVARARGAPAPDGPEERRAPGLRDVPSPPRNEA